MKTVTKLSVLYLLFCTIHIAVSFCSSLPLIYNDEAGYIGKARLLVAGYLPYTLGMHQNGRFVDVTYYPGYGLLLSPLFLITNKIESVYKLIQIANSLLLSLIPLISYRLSRVLAGDIPDKYHIAAAIAIGCYPPFLLQSNVAWSESLFIPLFLILCLQIHHLSQSPGTLLSWTLPTLSFGALLATHPRAFAVLPALLIAFLLIAYGMLDKAKRKYVIAACTLVSTLFLLMVAYFVIKNGAGYSSIVQGIFAKAPTLSGFFSLLLSINNKMLYVMLASAGFAILGIFRSLRIITNQRGNRDIIPLTVFCLFSFIFVLLLTAIMMNGTDHRADHIIYGRYVEGVIAPLFLWGFVEYYKKGYGAMFGIVACLVIVTSHLTVSSYLNSLVMNGINILGIYSYRLFSDSFNFTTVILVFIATLVVILAAGFHSRLLSVIVVGAIFSISSVSIAYDYFAKAAQSVSKSLELVTPLQKYVDSGGKKILSFDKHSLTQSTIGHVYPYPIHIPQLGVAFFDSKAAESSPSELYINGSWKAPAKETGARLVGIENHFNQYLWLLPGKTQERFIRDGYVLPENFPAPLPDGALHASFSLPEHTLKVKGGKMFLPLTIKHEGKGAFWPNAGGLKQSADSIGVSIILFNRNNLSQVYAEIFDLPHSVYPGQTIDLDLPLEFISGTIPDGEYLLRIDLLQQGVRLFAEIQDSGVNLPLRIAGKHVKIGERSPFPGDPRLLSHYVPNNGQILPQYVIIKENIYRDNNWTNGDAILKGIRYEVKSEDNFLCIVTNGGSPLSGNMDKLKLQVAVDKVDLEYISNRNNKYFFKLPKGIKKINEVSVKSRTFVPKELGINVDDRKLGIDLAAIRFTGEAHD